MTASGVVAALLTVPLLVLPAAAVAPNPAAADPCAAPTIVGTPDDDVLVGTAGADVIDGGAGDDSLRGGAGDDVLCGGDGHDALVGGDGDDELYGEGDGWVGLEEVGYFEGDSLDGGPGDDLLDGGRDSRTRPLDSLLFERSAAGVEVDLSAGTAQGDGSDVVVGPFVEVYGSAHADHLVGAALGERLVGGKGADTIEGGDGGDRIWTGVEDGPDDGASDVADGGAGDDWVSGDGRGDRLAGGPGGDLVEGIRARLVLGGPGRDHLFDTIDRSGAQVLRGGPGRDQASLSSPAAWRGTAWEVVRGRVELASDVARFRTKQGTVRVTLAEVEGVSVRASGRWVLVGTPGNDALEIDTSASRGAVLIGRGGNDILRGSRRPDLLRGGPGDDIGWGRGGRDRYSSIEKRR